MRKAKHVTKRLATSARHDAPNVRSIHYQHWLTCDRSCPCPSRTTPSLLPDVGVPVPGSSILPALLSRAAPRMCMRPSFRRYSEDERQAMRFCFCQRWHTTNRTKCVCVCVCLFVCLFGFCCFRGGRGGGGGNAPCSFLTLSSQSSCNAQRGKLSESVRCIKRKDSTGALLL